MESPDKYSIATYYVNECHIGEKRLSDDDVLMVEWDEVYINLIEHYESEIARLERSLDG